MQRAKYRQYEDNQTIIEKIRYYRTQRYPDCEIIKKLDNMPRRTYYNYVEKLQEQDKELMMQWMAENMEQVSEGLIAHRETNCQVIRELQEIIEDENTLPKTKMQAIDQKLAISEKLENFVNSGMSNTIKTELINALEHFDPHVLTPIFYFCHCFFLTNIRKYHEPCLLEISFKTISAILYSIIISIQVQLYLLQRRFRI
jgi:hypothetical protein